MLQSNNEDKQILYNSIKRSVGNLMSGIPVFGMFSGSVADYLIKYIDPYVSAFTDEEGLDIEQLGDFAKEEINDKIEKFKMKYKKESKNNENKINF